MLVSKLDIDTVELTYIKRDSLNVVLKLVRSDFTYHP